MPLPLEPVAPWTQGGCVTRTEMIWHSEGLAVQAMASAQQSELRKIGFVNAPLAVAGVVRSEDLLGSRQTVDIEHNGQRYRLQSTKAGKLILTK